MLRRDFWFLTFGRDIFMVWHLLAVNSCSRIEWLPMGYSFFMPLSNFVKINCDRDVFMVLHFGSEFSCSTVKFIYIAVFVFSTIYWSNVMVSLLLYPGLTTSVIIYYGLAQYPIPFSGKKNRLVNSTGYCENKIVVSVFYKIII